MEEKKSDAKKIVQRTSNCESCEFYDYDEYYGEYTCRMNLDEDEMVNYLSRNTAHCHYYRYYDEYKSVHKQIWIYNRGRLAIVSLPRI